MTYPCLWFSEQVRLAGDLRSTNDVLIPLVEEEIKETMTEPTVEEYMTITRLNYVSGNIENGRIELKGRFLEELRNNASSGTNGEDVIEHIGNFLKIVDLLKVPNVSDDQLRVRVFPFSLTRAASRWWKDEIDAQITT
ncbi:hypothetical protein Tco_0756921 [Tanacetum coccineum]